MATYIKKRGGGKKKTLFETKRVKYSIDANASDEEKKETRKEIEASLRSFNDMNLESSLDSYEKHTKAILKAAKIPTSKNKISEHTNNYEYPIHVSYAADILFSIYKVRDFLKKGEATKAAYAALKLGRYIACNDAELIRASRATRNPKPARDIKSEPAKARRLKMQKIAEDLCHWKEGTILTEEQWKEVKAAFRKTFSVKDRPTASTILKDAQAIGLRPKPKK